MNRRPSRKHSANTSAAAFKASAFSVSIMSLLVMALPPSFTMKSNSPVILIKSTNAEPGMLVDANNAILHNDNESQPQSIKWQKSWWLCQLDYCNSILYGTSSSNLNKLQRVQNALARSVMMTKKRDHITPVLARLHWLPVTARIQFKIALLTFQTITTHQPSYIHDLLQPHWSSRQLRSASRNLLRIQWMRTGFAQRSFTYSVPHIWNSLPHVITGNLDVTANTFKKKL